MRIDRVGVLGGGPMGAGMAEMIARSGMEVTVRELDRGSVGLARTRIGTSLDRVIAANKLDASEREVIMERIEVTTSLGSIELADLVIEAVPEHLELKRGVLAQLRDRVRPDALIASNTSSTPIAQLAAVLPNPERVLGLHFFSPVPVMKLVEVVVALDTSPQTVSIACEFVEHLGKRPIETKDRSGFIVNMLLVPYLIAAVRMYEEGFATAEAIDEGMRLGCGHPMGPLALCDFIGLDVLYAVCGSVYEEFKRPEYAPPPLLKRMLAAGRLGRNGERGFYAYPPAPVAAGMPS